MPSQIQIESLFKKIERKMGTKDNLVLPNIQVCKIEDEDSRDDIGYRVYLDDFGGFEIWLKDSEEEWNSAIEDWEQTNEPVYKYRSFSEWFDEYPKLEFNKAGQLVSKFLK